MIFLNLFDKRIRMAGKVEFVKKELITLAICTIGYRSGSLLFPGARPNVGEVIEQLEDDLLTNPDNSIRERIHHLKKGIAYCSEEKVLLPLREAISRFSKSESRFYR